MLIINIHIGQKVVELPPGDLQGATRLSEAITSYLRVAATRFRHMKNFVTEKIVPHMVPAAILLTIAFIVYYQILGHDFQLFWDDEKYITTNETIKGFSFAHIKDAFSGSYLGNYAPLHIISYMLDYSLWGLKASGFLLTNLSLHLCNALLFYFLLIRFDLGKIWAFFSAYVFLTHPVQVETVAWISERKNVLAMFFFLLAFISYVTYRERGWQEGKAAYAASLILFVCALLSKSVAVIFPLMLVLYEFCYHERTRCGRLAAEILPYLCAAAIMAWVTMESQMPGEVPGLGGGRIPYHGGSPFATFLTMVPVLALYLKLVIWPAGLSAMYDPAIRTGIDWAVAGGMILLALAAVGGVLLFQKKRRLFFWYGLFFLGLIPVSQIVPIATLMNDRYLYFPMLGASVCFGSLASSFLASVSGAQRFAASALIGLILLALPVLSFFRAGVWKNELTLWHDAADKSPSNTVALYGFGQALQNSGDLDAARKIYEKVLRRSPRHLDTLIHLAAVYRSKNLPFEGRPYLLNVTRYYPRLPAGYADLGMNYYQTGDLAKAETAFRTVLALQPRSRDAAWYLGIIALRTKRPAEATVFFQMVASLSGTNADIEYNLACAESISGHPREALQHLESALKRGFRDKTGLENDRDLDAIRPLPGFRMLERTFWGNNGAQQPFKQ